MELCALPAELNLKQLAVMVVLAYTSALVSMISHTCIFLNILHGLKGQNFHFEQIAS